MYSKNFKYRLGLFQKNELVETSSIFGTKNSKIRVRERIRLRLKKSVLSTEVMSVLQVTPFNTRSKNQPSRYGKSVNYNKLFGVFFTKLTTFIPLYIIIIPARTQGYTSYKIRCLFLSVALCFSVIAIFS